MGAQQRAQQYNMYTPRGASPSQSESWLRRRMENIENHPQARLPGFARRYLFNVDTHPRIPVTNRHRELAEIEEALQKESHVRRGEMVLERRRRLAEQWRQQHSGGGSAAQQVAAAAQPEEDFEDVFETVNKYFRDLPDEDDVPATQSTRRPPPPPPPPPPRGRARSRSERRERRFPEKPDSEWVPTEQMFPDKEDTSWDPRREPKNAPSRASYLKPPDLSGIDSNNIDTPPRSRASSRRDRKSIDDNNVDTPAGSRASSQASARGRGGRGGAGSRQAHLRLRTRGGGSHAGAQVGQAVELQGLRPGRSGGAPDAPWARAELRPRPAGPDVQMNFFFLP